MTSTCKRCKRTTRRLDLLCSRCYTLLYPKADAIWREDIGWWQRLLVWLHPY
jgi:predicted amidophosphoribosyltransferase